MKKGNTGLAAILVICLAVCVALALLFAGADPAAGQSKQEYGILISEICTKNETVIPDNSGSYPDYIELYNPGEAVSLKGFTLTDGKAHSAPLGDIRLEQGEYRVIFLGDRNAGFGLGASGGDCIQLLDAAGSIVVQANTTALREDQVMLYENGSYEVSDQPSPGFSNDASGIHAFRVGREAEAAVLQISELLLSNKSSLPDENGVYSDVIELYNSAEKEIHLDRFFLSDDPENRFSYRLPEVTLAPGAYALIFCDGENRIGTNGEIHANFGLSFGESLIMTDNTGAYVTVKEEVPGEDVSLVLQQDGSYAPGSVSLGFENTQEGSIQFLQTRVNLDAPLVISEVLLSSAGVPWEGVIGDVVEITNISGETVSTQGYYLSDGSDPYRFALPHRELKSGEVLVIPCGPNSTGFSLSDGELLRLTGPDYKHGMLVPCTADEPGQSVLYTQEGYSYGPVSLGYANDAQGAASFLMDSKQKHGLLIAEVMSTNTKYLMGPYGRTSDWVELYNASDSDIELSDYALSDNPKHPGQHALPAGTLAAGERVVYLLSNEGLRLLAGYEVLPFGLSPEGDQLYLSKAGMICDYLQIPALDADVSYGMEETTGIADVLEMPTPGKENSSAVPACETSAEAMDQNDALSKAIMDAYGFPV